MSVPADTAAAAPPPRRPGLLRRLYEWVLHWSETPYGTPALAAISFMESSFFPIPPDVLQIALSLSKPRRSFYYAFVSAVASVLGGMLGYVLGYFIWEATQEFWLRWVPGFSREIWDQVVLYYNENAFLWILLAAFTPIPYKVFTLAAGACHVPFAVLVLASAVGRSGRFFLVATLIYTLGDRVRRVLDRYLEWLTLALAALGVGGFFAVRWLVS